MVMHECIEVHESYKGPNVSNDAPVSMTFRDFQMLLQKAYDVLSWSHIDLA